MEYYVFVVGGNPPRFKHNNLESAKNEARRLNSMLAQKVEILAIIGEVFLKEVPVTTKVQEIEMFDDLPF